MTKHPSRKIKQQRYVYITRIAAILLFGVALAISGLRYSGLFDTPQAQTILDTVYKIYEGVVRVLLYGIGVYCALAYAKLKGRPASKFRKFSLITLTVLVLVALGLIPLLSGIWEYYLMFMPFPITTPAFQLHYLGEHYGHTFTEVYGATGLRIALALYFGYHILAYLGVLLWGRRAHCSVLCVFNGSTAEILALGLPVIPFNKKHPQSKSIPPTARRILTGLQIVYIALSGSIVVLWITHGLFNFTPVPLETLVAVESNAYLILAPFLMSVLTLFLGARAFCHYCPAGTLYGWIGRAAGQEITTNLTECIQCGLCNQACKMSLDIMGAAAQKIPLRSARCVGCGLCVDACPKGNLAYATTFTRWLKQRRR